MRRYRFERGDYSPNNTADESVIREEPLQSEVLNPPLMSYLYCADEPNQSCSNVTSLWADRCSGVATKEACVPMGQCTSTTQFCMQDSDCLGIRCDHNNNDFPRVPQLTPADPYLPLNPLATTASYPPDG